MNTPAVIKRAVIIAVWIAIWQLAAVLIDNHILLAGPLEVLITLANDVVSAIFWLSVGNTFVSITCGFLAAFVLGVCAGALAGRFNTLREFLEPLIQIIKSVPIVCVIVLLLLWFGSAYTSIIATFLVALPPVYAAVLGALGSKDEKLFNMLRVFNVSSGRLALTYYWATLLPFLNSACKVAVGMSWKAGVAAELIGLPFGTIGEKIYQAKLTLSSAELFSWTAVIVVISLVCEKLFLIFLQKSETWAWRAALPRFAQSSESVAAHSNAPVVFNDVTVSFGEQTVLKNLSISFESGGRYALRGPSGSGKTTILSLIEGSLLPSSGKVENSASAAVVFQEARLFENHSAYDNVRLIAGQYKKPEEISRALEALLPADSLNKPVKELSGGMRRRVEMVRALLYPSELLLLDEPFSGLDDKSAEQARSLLVQLLDNRTLIISTHSNEDERNLGLKAVEVTLI